MRRIIKWIVSWFVDTGEVMRQLDPVPVTNPLNLSHQRPPATKLVKRRRKAQRMARRANRK